MNTKFESSFYKDKQGEEYAKYIGQNEINHLGHKLNSKFYIPFLNKDMHVLDFGCGNGSLAKAIEPYVVSIEGLEINEYPRTIATTQGLNVYSSIEQLSGVRKYDAIISNHVLEHIPNVIETLSLLREHLNPGGLFITMLPIDDYREATNKRWNPKNMDRHLHTWTPLLLGNTFTEAGFSPISISVVSHAWSHRFFFLGDTFLQSLTCKALSIILKRRQILAVCKI
jgi:cyclopropane fatty-acyl-phospholipid synthase-like methyltransferase